MNSVLFSQPLSLVFPHDCSIFLPRFPKRTSAFPTLSNLKRQQTSQDCYSPSHFKASTTV
uniref:Uncharacterized protein n=1 Tax=Anguilla anguilla TaxID=7936 RepID=A0A0E9WFS4_ANGAN